MGPCTYIYEEKANPFSPGIGTSNRDLNRSPLHLSDIIRLKL